MGTRELLEQARNLSAADRLELVDAVLQSLYPSDPVIDHAWLEEARHRLAAHRSGKTPGIPAEDILGAV